jgi:ferric-dicitrate binding protein FerR (iron transport regulator)
MSALTLATGTAFAAAPAEPEVGTTVQTLRHVLGILGTQERKLQKGLRVHRNELVRTGARSQVELTLDDNTRLALGADAELRLDEYAVSSDKDARSIAVRFLKGTLRFLTGRSTSESYKIETPSATIGVRGTIFDLYIAPNGDTFVLLHQGEVEICSRTRACRPHRTVGRVVQASISGIVSDPVRWTASLVGGGVTAAQAFPFVGRRLVVDPVRRLTHRSITQGTRTIERGGKEIERTIRKISPF